MKRLALLVILSFIYLSIPSAAANLTINGSDMVPDFINTIDKTSMVNITFNLTNTSDSYDPFIINISYINVTINSSTEMNISNVTAVEIINASGIVVASNTTNSSYANFTIYFGSLASGGFIVNSSISNYTNLIIAINVSRFGNITDTVMVNISSNMSFGYAGNHNITVNTNQSHSNFSTIVDVHANATITPNYIDINTFNQTFLYTINVTGSDAVENITITIPTEFTNVTILNVKRDGSVITSGGSTLTQNITTNNVINITMNAPASSSIVINFTANASASALANITFNSTIRNNRLNASINNVNTGVQTLNIITIDRIVASKLTALPNGTDYWEFNFTLNFSVNVSGGLMFKMDNWLNNQSQEINVNTSTISYANFRLDTNGSRFVNVTTTHNESRYVPMTLVSTSQQHMDLKMIVPGGTPVSSSWWTKYFMLFKVDPDPTA